MATAESNSANGAMLSPEATMIEVASGGFVDVLNPDPETLHIADIAQGLSMTCRYGGHIKRFYSVAEHSVLVHDLLAERGAGPATLHLALFHDAAEAYLGDIVAPLKYALRSAEFDYPGAIHRASNLRAFKGAYAHLSDRMDCAIAERFELSGGVVADVQLADMWALRIESAKLTASGGANWRWPGELPLDGRLPEGVDWHGGLSPETARRTQPGDGSGALAWCRGDPASHRPGGPLMAAGGRNWPDDVRIGDVIVRRVPHPILGNPERVVTLVDSHRIEFKDGWMSRGSLRDYRLVRRAGEEGDEHGD